MTKLQGLYVITPEQRRHVLPLAAQVEQAIAGGARIVQYRNKGKNADRRMRDARAIRAICVAAGIPLIINDDLELALAVGADGIHLGRDDARPAEARARLGAAAIIGVSCYDRFERAEWAQETGASYVAFGRFFPSSTKPLAVQAGPALLRRAARATGASMRPR